MSTEHEGGQHGPEQPAPAGEATTASPYAQERAVPTDAADDTVVQPVPSPVVPSADLSPEPAPLTPPVAPGFVPPVSPPADPALAGFPPPIAVPATPQPQAQPQPQDATPVQDVTQVQPVVRAETQAETEPQAEPQTLVKAEAPGYEDAPVPAAPVQPAPLLPPAPAQPAYHPADAPAYPQQTPGYPQQTPAYGTQPVAAHAQPQPYAQPQAGTPYGGVGVGTGDAGTGGLPPYAGYPGSAYPPPGHGPQDPYGPAPRKKRRGGLVALLAVTAIIAGAVGGGIGASLENHDSSSGTTTVTTGVDPKALSRAPDSIAGIAARALPSVVTISASNSQESGTGTGFVYDTDGHILTNNHVVAPSDNGGKLSVKFSDGSSYPATIVGRASGYDVAVIKIVGTPKKPLVPLALGNSDAVAVGDSTIAIGAPFGLSGTVTSGIISAKNRPVASGDQTGAQTSYMNALQTDASINPGNSGGPLMNASGQVVGIDSAIQSTGQSTGGGQAGSIGLGFAIPINQAKWVADQLIKTGKPVYPIIGVLRDDTYTGAGAKISASAVDGNPAITPNGPADQAGLKPGDIITELGGVQIDSGPTLVSEIWSHHPGDVVSVTYTRNGQSHTTNLTLGHRDGDQ